MTSVLGPILFFVYINDQQDKLSFQVDMFADDMATYVPDKGSSNAGTVLQNNLGQLFMREDRWDLEFNPS